MSSPRIFVQLQAQREVLSKSSSVFFTVVEHNQGLIVNHVDDNH